jgi:hypothetical protein
MYTLQDCRSNQYGKIVAGLVLIHYRSSAAAASVLSVDENGGRGGAGVKQALWPDDVERGTFGKAVGNAVWLDEKQMSAFDFW